MNYPTLIGNADARLVDLWLHGRPETTQSVYRASAGRFLVATGKPLATVTLGDLQQFADSLVGLAPATRCKHLSAVKSLLAFGHRLGLLTVNAGAALRLPANKETLGERILPEADVQRMLALEPDRRNRTMLRLMYAAGLRVSEVCGLKWRDVQPRTEVGGSSAPAGGQIVVFGKGSKTRAIILPASIFGELVTFRGTAGRDGVPPTTDAPVFRSQHGGSGTSAGGGHLGRAQVLRIVQAAAKRANIAANVSPHWLRHAHASHALDRGAPISLVQATLGHASVATTGRYTHARPADSSARYLAV